MDSDWTQVFYAPSVVLILCSTSRDGRKKKETKEKKHNIEQVEAGNLTLEIGLGIQILFTVQH